MSKLKNQLFWPIAIAGVVLVLFGSASVLYLFSKDRFDLMQHHARTVLGHILYAVESSSAKELSRRISVIAADRSVLSVIVLSENRTILASSRPENKGRNLTALPENVIEIISKVLDEGVEHAELDFSGKVFVMAQPVLMHNTSNQKGKLEQAVLYVQLDEMHSYKHFIFSMIAMFSVMVIIALLMAGASVLIAQKRVIRPVEIFKNTIARQKEGQKDLSVPIIINNEIGLLAVEFNRLTLERVKADENLQQALKDSEIAQKRYQGIVNFAMDAVIVIDTDFNIIVFNSEAEKLFGVNRDVMIGETLEKLLPERFRGGHRKHVSNFLCSESNGRRMSERGEVFALRSDGSEFPVEVSLSKVRVDDTIYLTAILRDISKLKLSKQELEVEVSQRTEQLQISQQRLEEAQNMAHIGNWELDLQTNKLYWSKEIFRMFEVDPNKFKASYEAFISAIHPDDRELVNDAYSQSLVDKKPYNVTHRLLMRDGTIKYVVENCNSFFDEDGNAIRSVGTVQDISKQVMSQHEAEQFRDLMQKIIDSSPDWIYAKDVENKYLAVSRSFASALHLRPEEIVGKSDTELGNSRLCNENDGEVLKGEVVRYSNDVVRGVDGAEKIFDTYKCPLQDSSGEIYGVLAYSRDLTDYNKTLNALESSEKKLIELNDSLESRVTERTRELEKAKELAEKANRAKSEFLSGMSHELRTPMNAILGFTQLLQLEDLDEEHQELMQEISHAGSHLLKLIDELLDLSKIESGRLNAIVERTHIFDLVKESLSFVQHNIEKHNIRVISDFDNSVDYSVFADTTRLKQIIVNLLTNAIKYNRLGGEIRLQTSIVNQRLRFMVSDSGVGIDQSKMHRLFKPFDRLGAESTGIEGTGVGLALCKKLIELMGGEIGVESTPGVGSKFWIDLSLAEIPADEIDISSVTDEITIIYVEDNPANLRLIEAGLRHIQDFKLITATAGDYGLELIRKYKPDVILLDINLPTLNGYEIKSCLRVSQDLQNIPVIAISADAMPHDVEKGLNAGFVKYFTKPVNIEELIDTLRAVTTNKIGNEQFGENNISENNIESENKKVG